MIILNNNDMISADCVVISTDDPLGQCYISTSNLDGEKNLKAKLAPSVSQGKHDEALTIDYGEPNKDIYSFEGVIKNGTTQTELGLRQFMPRGSIVKNS